MVKQALNDLSNEQGCALAAFRSRYGRQWKAALLKSWQNGVYPGVEQDHWAVLNSLKDMGESWLAGYTAQPMIKTGSVHKNPDFNIIQDTSVVGGVRPANIWSVIKGDRSPGGYASSGSVVFKQNMTRDEAIWLADTLQRMHDHETVLYCPSKGKLNGQSNPLINLDTGHIDANFLGYTFDDYRAKYPEAVIVTYDELQDSIRAFAVTKPIPITAEQYEEALYVLPPAHWRSGDNNESFQSCEMFVDNITSIYVQHNGLHYSFRDVYGLSHDAIINKVKDALPHMVCFDFNITPKTVAEMPQQILEFYSQSMTQRVITEFNERNQHSGYYAAARVGSDPSLASLWSIKAADGSALPPDVVDAATSTLHNTLYADLPSHREWCKLVSEYARNTSIYLCLEQDADMQVPYLLTDDGEIHTLESRRGKGPEGVTATAGTTADLVAVLFFHKDHAPDFYNDYAAEKEALLNKIEFHTREVERSIGPARVPKFWETIEAMKGNQPKP